MPTHEVVITKEAKAPLGVFLQEGSHACSDHEADAVSFVRVGFDSPLHGQVYAGDVLLLIDGEPVTDAASAAARLRKASVLRLTISRRQQLCSRSLKNVVITAMVVIAACSLALLALLQHTSRTTRGAVETASAIQKKLAAEQVLHGRTQARLMVMVESSSRNRQRLAKVLRDRAEHAANHTRTLLDLTKKHERKRNATERYLSGRIRALRAQVTATRTELSLRAPDHARPDHARAWASAHVDVDEALAGGILESGAMRTWPRCIFQSIHSTPIDQLLLLLLGGSLLDGRNQSGLLARMWKHRCDMFAEDAADRKRHCPCAVPTRLIGTGSFVEIGAHDGVHMSNSWFFEHYLGWRGMCVEANPYTYRKLAANRPKCVNVNALVARDTSVGSRQFLAFYRTNDSKVVRPPSHSQWETGLSGVLSPDSDKTVLRSLEAARHFARRYGLRVESVPLRVERFAHLFALHGFERIDVLSIDVEGFEYAVVSSIDFERVAIRYIVMEAVNPDVGRLLTQHGFVDLGLQLHLGDRIFAHRRHAEMGWSASRTSQAM